ncbi:DUF397 domain-containing protein [Streptomyces sp. FH025]|uniref:DUF397 domain-containing protein n=1 Tax=Streptomyces sp. FH025 TaxID=2815937 RepID=UPI0027DD2119|nr:DUF397 domain-containing protein [Streptomyces sp. FH025]
MRGLNNVTNSRMPVIHPNRHADWKKSSHSEGDGGNCVEVALNLAVSGVVPVRDSKDRSGPALGISASGWESFIAAVQAGEFGEV